MCEVPRRTFRHAITPQRVVVLIVAVAAIWAALILPDGTISLALLVLGIGALFAAVLFPAIRDVEFGFPSGVKVRASLEDRHEELSRAFTAQKGDFSLCAQLLCPEPEIATTLLEAAWSQTASEWRGPVTANLRPYVLCVFVHLLESHAKWAGRASTLETQDAAPLNPLLLLTLPARTVVVLREFAHLPLAEVANITERPLADIAADLRDAQATLAFGPKDGRR